LLKTIWGYIKNKQVRIFEIIVITSLTHQTKFGLFISLGLY